MLGVYVGVVDMIMNRTQEMSCTEGHKKYRQPQRRTFMNHICLKTQLEEFK